MIVVPKVAVINGFLEWEYVEIMHSYDAWITYLA